MADMFAVFLISRELWYDIPERQDRAGNTCDDDPSSAMHIELEGEYARENMYNIIQED
jgi:hypothetical protein